MGWTLLLAAEDGALLEESQTLLDDELAEYLAGLEGFPSLQGLRNLPREAETPLPVELRDSLAREVEALAARAKRRELPEPPEWVGLEGTGDLRLGEPLGWSGLLAFLQRLEHLVFLSRQMGLELWASSED
jgi:hypothetical protein